MKINLIIISLLFFNFANAGFAPIRGTSCKRGSTRFIELECNGYAVTDPSIQCLGLLDAALKQTDLSDDKTVLTKFYVNPYSDKGSYALAYDAVDNSILLNTEEGEFKVKGQVCSKIASEDKSLLNPKGKDVYALMSVFVKEAGLNEIRLPEDFYNKDVKFSNSPADCAKLLKDKNPKLADVFTKLEGKFAFPKSTPRATGGGKQ